MHLQDTKVVIRKLNLSSNLIDANNCVAKAVLPTVMKILHKALGERVSLIALQQSKPSEVVKIVLQSFFRHQKRFLFC
jgi:hypothetical protein